MVVANDITKKIKTEQGLLQSELRLNQAQAIAHLGNWEVNFATNTSKWSDEAYRIYGLEPGDHGLSVEEWMSFIHPEDMDYVKQEVERSEAMLSNYTLNHRIIRQDGVIRNVYSESKYELNPEGKPIGLYGIVIDVTEIKKAEQELSQSEMRLNEAQAIAHISNWEIDLEHNMQNWSDEFYRIYGLNKSKVRPSTELFLSLMHPDDVVLAQKIVEEAFFTLKGSSFNFRFIRKDGRIRYGHSEWKFEFDKKGKPVRLFGILQDITEHKKAEAELKKMEEELFEQHRLEQVNITATALEAQEKERTAIGRELHDNVNQILAGTKLILSIAKTNPEKIQEVIDSCMDNLQDAIDENRKIAHVLVAPDFEAKILTEELSQLTDNMLKKSALEVNFDVTHFREELLNDHQKLAVYRIAQEQCTNIVKYAKARLVNISLSTDDDLFKMIITDDGVGMNPGKKMSGIGIRNIKGRLSIFNGNSTINTATGKGFSLEITIPLGK